MQAVQKQGSGWFKGRRAFIVAALAATGVFAAPGLHAQQGVTANEIVIGALGPLTGAFAFIGAPGRDGIALAVDKINEAGGINGRKLRLIFEGANTPAESVAAAKKLVEESKVFALVLASGSTGAAAAADPQDQSGQSRDRAGDCQSQAAHAGSSTLTASGRIRISAGSSVRGSPSA